MEEPRAVSKSATRQSPAHTIKPGACPFCCQSVYKTTWLAHRTAHACLQASPQEAALSELEFAKQKCAVCNKSFAELRWQLECLRSHPWWLQDRHRQSLQLFALDHVFFEHVYDNTPLRPKLAADAPAAAQGAPAAPPAAPPAATPVAAAAKLPDSSPTKQQQHEDTSPAKQHQQLLQQHDHAVKGSPVVVDSAAHVVKAVIKEVSEVGGTGQAVQAAAHQGVGH